VGGRTTATGQRAVERAVSVSQHDIASAQIHGNGNQLPITLRYRLSFGLPATACRYGLVATVEHCSERPTQLNTTQPVLKMFRIPRLAIN